MMQMNGKPVSVYAEATGATTETQLANWVVSGAEGHGETKNHYIIKKGFKLKIFDVELNAEGETRLWIRVGTDSTFINSVRRKSYKLASAGNLHIPYAMPQIIEAMGSDIHVFLSYQQTSAAAMRCALNAELKELGE